MTAVGIQGFINMTAISSLGISRPFDVERDGFVIAEGAAVLVLEEWDAAHARGAHIYGEIMGGASTADAHHITAPSPGGAGAIACIDLALAEAGVRPSDIKQINAHGTSTPLNDAAEAQAIEKVFGTPGPPVTSTKGVTGHTLGAAGALEAAAVLISMERKLIPPTAGFAKADRDMHIDIVHGEPARGSRGRRCRTRSGSAATTACWSSAPRRGRSGREQPFEVDAQPEVSEAFTASGGGGCARTHPRRWSRDPVDHGQRRDIGWSATRGVATQGRAQTAFPLPEGEPLPRRRS